MSAHAFTALHDTSALAPVARELASAPGWTLSEVVCSAGPADPVFEERHEREQFAEVAASAAGSGSFEFGHAMLPPGPKLLPALSALEALHGDARAGAAAELVLAFVQTVTALCAGYASRRARAPTARESRRIGAVLQRVAEEPQAAWDLDALAAAAAMSKYHFLRCFRRLCGVTPHQYLLERRLRRAACLLQRDPGTTIAAVAFEAGFRDLSSFNQQFRTAFGATPGVFRARGAGGLRKE